MRTCTETPDVDRKSVLGAENDFGCTIKSRLNVCVHLLMFEAARTEVDHFKAAAPHLQRSPRLSPA